MTIKTQPRQMGPKPLPRHFDARILFALFSEDCDDTLIGEALGVGRTQVNRWRNDREYLLTDYHADKIAIRIGTHPALIWGRQWWDTAEQ